MDCPNIHGDPLTRRILDCPDCGTALLVDYCSQCEKTIDALTEQVDRSKPEGYAALGGLCPDCYHDHTRTLIKQASTLHTEINRRNHVLSVLTQPARTYIISNKCLCGFSTPYYFDLQRHLAEYEATDGHSTTGHFQEAREPASRVASAPRAPRGVNLADLDT